MLIEPMRFMFSRNLDVMHTITGVMNFRENKLHKALNQLRLFAHRVLRVVTRRNKVQGIRAKLKLKNRLSKKKQHRRQHRKRRRLSRSDRRKQQLLLPRPPLMQRRRQLRTRKLLTKPPLKRRRRLI